MAKIDQQAETESMPAMDVHVGETYVEHVPKDMQDNEHGKTNYARHCIVWLNGKRWEGVLFENTQRDFDNLHHH
jgi:hypothetical protein